MANPLSNEILRLASEIEAGDKTAAAGTLDFKALMEHCKATYDLIDTFRRSPNARNPGPDYLSKAMLDDLREAAVGLSQITLGATWQNKARQF